MIKALIIEDNKNCRETIELLIAKYHPEITIIGTAANGARGLQAIHDVAPDVVFLDVEMPDMTGFEMLSKLRKINFNLIFTTAHQHYAIQAIRFSAIDYLLKPIDREELNAAIQKVMLRSMTTLSKQLEILLNKLNRPSGQIFKIALPTMEGLQMISLDQIISCQSSSNYTIVNLKGVRNIMVSRTLKDVEELLQHHHFLRIHHSNLVNLNEIVKYVKGDGGYLMMSDGTKIIVSRGRRELLLTALQPQQ